MAWKMVASSVPWKNLFFPSIAIVLPQTIFLVNFVYFSERVVLLDCVI